MSNSESIFERMRQLSQGVDPKAEPKAVAVQAEPKAVAVQAEPKAVAVQAEPKATPVNRGAPKAASKPETTPKPYRSIGTLYVDCQPLFGLATHFYEILACARATLPQDYRLVPYGQGAASLIEAVGAELQKRRAESLVIQTGGPESNVCLDMLKGVSDRIVIGTR